MALVRTKSQFFRSYLPRVPDERGRLRNSSEPEEFIICPNSIYDVRTSLQFFGIDPYDFETIISELFRRRSTDGGVKFVIWETSKTDREMSATDPSGEP